ncbi:MAG: IgA Peptidase M64 [Phycisphaerae bacterium]|nr:IgA Peptidase M64 [Phycisphaerae bacterium]
MKSLINYVLFVLLVPFAYAQAADFADYFEDATMRIDYFHTANAACDEISIDRIYITGTWAGNPKKLLSPTENGKYAIKVVDAASNKLIYSRHFLDIVFEYKGTEPAKQGLKRTYHQTALIPCPRQPVLLTIERRDKHHKLHSVFSQIIDPNDRRVKRESSSTLDKTFVIVKNGPPHDFVDLVFVAEGYTSDEFDKFRKDSQRFVDYLFSVKPFAALKNKFNISGVFRPSAQSGVDIPIERIYKNTAVGASYDTFGSGAYVTVFDNKAMRDIAGMVPYDHVIILANTEMYGGSGFYNSYTLFTSDNKRSAEIFTHELGHGLAGLADEYIAESYFDVYYTRGVEPLEPNITAYLNPGHVKWACLVSPSAPMPTPAKEEYNNTVGLFEGAGYTKTGMYRSCRHCVMGAGGLPYCKACQDAIEKVVQYYTN